jgi:MinD superfamily P-loop ATPase
MFIKGESLTTQRARRMVPQWEAASCRLCGKCQQVCKFGAVLKLEDRIMVIPEMCHSCYACSELCPTASLPMHPSALGSISLSRQANLDFIEAKLDVGIEQATPLIKQCLDYAGTHFGTSHYQFMDCPPGTSCAVMAATREADIVILVTEPTPFGLHDLSLAVDTMRFMGKPVAVVLNRYGIGNDDVLDYCQSQDIPVWAKIPHSMKLARLYSQGEILYQKDSGLRAALDGILEKLQEIA